MDFKTKNGSVHVALGLFAKKQKADFNRLLNDGGFNGDLSKAWKSYCDANTIANRKKSSKLK